MKRLIPFLFLELFVLSWNLVLVRPLEAADAFREETVVIYSVKTGGTTEVTHKINLKNMGTSVYAAGFTLTLDGYLPEKVEAFDRGGRMAVAQQRVGQKTLLNLTFNDMVIGKGNDYSFTIRYNLLDIAREKGQVWEIIIPKQGNAAQSEAYTLKMEVPATFGRVSFVSPSDYKLQDDGQVRTFTFDKKQVVDSRVVAAFGPVQVFDFDLRYHLQNEENYPQKKEIALPPDTTYQKMVFDTISPTPDLVWVDKDGNWIASFFLAPLEKLNIEVNGSVEISAAALKKDSLSDEDRYRYLMATDDWQKDDQRIASLAKNLKTPREIYDYVVTHLKYDYSRATITSETRRLGAKAALENPDRAICTEFTDLFIALARSAGIPARELQGYAYTNDPQLQPLSLIRDVLHAWPEFWDDKAGTWRQVDPTWGSTTGGVDFFTKLDFNHFVFVVHGGDTTNPRPAGSYRTDNGGRDVDIRFGEFRPFGKPKLDFYYQPEGVVQLPFLLTRGSLVVKNLGPVSVSDLNIDLKNSVFESSKKLALEVIPPYGSVKLPVNEKNRIFNWLGESVVVSAEGIVQSQVKVGMFRLAIAEILGAMAFVVSFFLILFFVLWRIKLVGVYFGRGKTG